ncbi:MAG: DUF3570 domain-containing protein [Pseudomonadota bacterium]|nr:DUF3570 domain-containing protein [Pseudomonadota bacterium]
MNNNKRNPGALAALTGAALALPAIAQLAQAAEMPTKAEIGYRYSDYQEDDVDADKVLVGSTERYDIDTHQFKLVAPLGERTSLTVDAMYETMTGASAMSVVQPPQGEAMLIMTGASIKEERTDVSAELRRYGDAGSKAVALGYSTEDDYEAINGSLDMERDSTDGVTTWSGGLGFSYDELEPVQEPGINRVTSEDRWFINGYVARAKVHSPVWQTQVGLYLGLYDGYLDDPYRSRDIRPDSRQQVAISARSRYFFTGIKAALHADYRYYSDDWGIAAHTLELAWHQTITTGLRVSPRIRYYSQSQADFYVEADSGTREGDQSSDYRLSPYGAIAYGLGLGYYQPNYSLLLYVEQYDSDADYALKSVSTANPFLVDYTLMTVGMDYRF